MDIRNIDRKYLGRDDWLGIQIVKSDGCSVYDQNGKRYIDFVSSWCVGNLGWGNSYIREKIRNFDGPDYTSPHFLYERSSKLAEELASIAPRGLVKSFRAVGGTESVEIALQASMAATGRSKFISIEGSYHGNSFGALSVGVSSHRERIKNLLPDCYKIEPPLDESAAEKIEILLKNSDIAAFIMEPIIMNIGVLIPEKEFMRRVRSACRKYGTMFVMDEVATGFGRTGKLFASEHFKLDPDIMCLAKAITSGYAPMGATIISEETAKKLEGKFDFYSTYGWHPLSIEAALATIEIFKKDQKKIFKNVEDKSNYIVERLNEMEFNSRFEIRAIGLAIGIEFEDKSYASEVEKRCRAKGLLVTTSKSDTLALFPPLIVDKKTCREAMDIVEDSI